MSTQDNVGKQGQGSRNRKPKNVGFEITVIGNRTTQINSGIESVKYMKHKEAKPKQPKVSRKAKQAKLQQLKFFLI